MTLEEALSRVELCIKFNLTLDNPQERHALKMLVKEIEASTDLAYRRAVKDE